MSEKLALIERRNVLQTLGGAAGAALLGTGSTAAATETRDGGDGRQPRYQLPELSYGYDALEPHIDERIMELHHSEHHQSYVDSANEALDEFEAMREAGEFEGIRAAKRDFSFNLSGHVNHTIFWQNMSPDGGGEPGGDLGTALAEQFGSFDDFRAEFSATANDVEGDGWAMLFYEPMADLLVIGQVEDQNELAHQRAIPILTLDVWEHAYYLQYENDRETYVEEWWNVVDWEDVQQRYGLLTGEREVDTSSDSEPAKAEGDDERPKSDAEATSAGPETAEKPTGSTHDGNESN